MTTTTTTTNHGVSVVLICLLFALLKISASGTGDLWTKTRALKLKRVLWPRRLRPHDQNRVLPSPFAFSWLRGGSQDNVYDSGNNNRRRPGVGADPFVTAAPLIMALACYDGSVALVAVHSQGGKEEEEPFMYDGLSRCKKNGPLLQISTEEGTNFTHTNLDSISQSPLLCDLPRDFGGPYRIHSLVLGQVALLSTGWRADCDTLLDQAQSLVQEEQARLGIALRPDGSHGRFLAQQLSLYLAKRAASEVSRLLSCASLVVSSGDGSSLNQSAATATRSNGKIWLTDATGIYSVRALAVGRNATRVNALLLEQFQTRPGDSETTWDATTGKSGLRSLLQVLTKALGCECRVELAILHAVGTRKPPLLECLLLEHLAPEPQQTATNSSGHGD